MHINRGGFKAHFLSLEKHLNIIFGQNISILKVAEFRLFCGPLANLYYLLYKNNRFCKYGFYVYPLFWILSVGIGQLILNL